MIGAGGRAGETMRLNEPVPVPPAFVALSVTGNVPLAAGGPVIAPVELLIVRPGGNPVALKLVGLLVALTW